MTFPFAIDTKLVGTARQHQQRFLSGLISFSNAGGNEFVPTFLAAALVQPSPVVPAFRKGGSLAVLYPIYATTFIWAALISMAAFGTVIKPINVAGMGLLICGMYCMGR